MRVKILGRLFLLLSLFLALQAHEGHETLFATEADFFANQSEGTSSPIVNWLSSIGRFHLIFLHFPIALVVMTIAAEWLWIWLGNPLFSQAARFMIVSAAIFAVPTALLGLAFGYGHNYEGIALDLYVWHRYFGLLTAGLAILAAILRERYVRDYSPSLKSYYISLFFLFLSINLTGAFGGSLTFGLDVW